MTLDGMTLVSETEAQVLHKFNVPVLCTAFVPRDKREYYAVGLTQAQQPVRQRIVKRVVTKELIKLSLKKPRFKRHGCKEEIVYAAARRVLKSDPTKTMPADELREAIAKETGLPRAEITPSFSRLITRHQLLEIVEGASNK